MRAYSKALTFISTLSPHIPLSAVVLPQLKVEELKQLSKFFSIS